MCNQLSINSQGRFTKNSASNLDAISTTLNNQSVAIAWVQLLTAEMQKYIRIFFGQMGLSFSMLWSAAKSVMQMSYLGSS